MSAIFTHHVASMFSGHTYGSRRSSALKLGVAFGAGLICAGLIAKHASGPAAEPTASAIAEAAVPAETQPAAETHSVAAKPDKAVPAAKREVADTPAKSATSARSLITETPLPSAAAPAPSPTPASNMRVIGADRITPPPPVTTITDPARLRAADTNAGTAPSDPEEPATIAKPVPEEIVTIAKALPAKAPLPPRRPLAATATPEPTSEKSEPVIAKLEPAIAKPEPAVSKPETVLAKVEPTISKPEPVETKPEPVAPALRPAQEAREPAAKPRRKEIRQAKARDDEKPRQIARRHEVEDDEPVITGRPLDLRRESRGELRPPAPIPPRSARSRLLQAQQEAEGFALVRTQVLPDGRRVSVFRRQEPPRALAYDDYRPRSRFFGGVPFDRW